MNENYLNEFLQKINTTKQEIVVRQLKWFKFRADSMMFLCRFCGVAVIFLSAIIPYLSTIETTKESIPIIAILITLFTGITMYMNTSDAWHTYRNSEINLRYIIASWEIKILTILAKEINDSEKIGEIGEITVKLIQETKSIANNETKKYFSSLEKVEKTIISGNKIPN